MKTNLHILLFLIGCLTVKAQDYCKKTSIYFELNKSDLTARANEKLDSLLHALTGNSYLIELYGYADSSATAGYNLQLSEKRTLAVQRKLNLKTSTSFHYREKNLGESKSTKDVSFDRRVDVFVFPEHKGKIVLSNPNESVELPVDYFGTCGICNSRPGIKAYYNAADADAANIKFKTSTGQDLITAGTIQFDFKPCDQSKANNQDTITLSIQADQVDPEMTVWEPDTINGIIYWKASDIKPIFDMVNKKYIVRSSKKFINFDRPAVKQTNYYYKILFPEELTGLRSCLMPDSKTRTHETRKDSLVLQKQDTSSSVISIGKINKTYYLLNEKPEALPAVTDINKKTLLVRKIYTVPFNLYKEFTYTDTTLKVKFKKKAKPEQFGFYLKAYNEFIPVDSDLKAKYIELKQPAVNYELAIITKKKLYVIEQKKVKPKYNRKKKLYKLKFNSGSMNHFKLNKTYTVDPK